MFVGCICEVSVNCMYVHVHVHTSSFLLHLFLYTQLYLVLFVSHHQIIAHNLKEKAQSVTTTYVQYMYIMIRVQCIYVLADSLYRQENPC